MKIIFLDVDWVLIKLSSSTKTKHTTTFDSEQVKILQDVLEYTGARIVVSSSWRHNMVSFMESWNLAGLDPSLVIGHTLSATDGWRSTEILWWLDNHHAGCTASDFVSHWVAVDDEFYEMKAIKRLGKLVKTNPSLGLTPMDGAMMKRILWQKRSWMFNALAGGIF